VNDDVEWLRPDEVRAWLAVAGLLEALPAVLNSQLKNDAGVNHFEYMLLAGLSESPGRSSPTSEIAAFAAGSLSRVSHALTRMESRGWVERGPRGGPGGQTAVTLTDEGMEIVRRAAPGHVAQVRELVVDRLGREDALELGRLAGRVLEGANPAVHRMLMDRYPEQDVRPDDRD
jgi:DNA-binding MarR family transcriptional regulator